jgi:cytochrome c oxidase subunit II
MRVASQRSSVAAFCLVIAALSTACGSGSAAGRETATGAQLYQACSSCHGPAGAGDIVQNAPAIAGLPEWYIASQLERFQTGLRGKHPDDVEGLKMRPMSLQVNSDQQRQAVAAYVAGLPAARSAATLSGTDAALGEQTYVMCLACHGPKGEGNRELNAPPLAGLDDWYVALQIRKFRSGIRGTAPGDAIGPTMAAMSMAVQPDAVNSLAAYVHALPR